MIKIEVKTNWECYSQYGNEAIELIAINSSYHGLHEFEGDAPPLDADSLAYIIHNVIRYSKANHVSDYLLKLFNDVDKEVTISKRQMIMLLEWCLKLQGDDYAPAYTERFCSKTNQKTISAIQIALRRHNDEWYDGERHQWIVKKIN